MNCHLKELGCGQLPRWAQSHSGSGYCKLNAGDSSAVTDPFAWSHHSRSCEWLTFLTDSDWQGRPQPLGNDFNKLPACDCQVLSMHFLSAPQCLGKVDCFVPAGVLWLFSNVESKTQECQGDMRSQSHSLRVVRLNFKSGLQCSRTRLEQRS